MHLVSLHHDVYHCDHTLWEQEVAGSNPAAPTNFLSNLHPADDSDDLTDVADGTDVWMFK
jgi:hypothetical protein